MKATFLLAATALCACANGPPAELVSARRSYEQARTGPAAQLAPDELARSRALLRQAEATYADGSSRRARDFAYAAQRQAERAETMARVEQAKQDKAAAERDLTAAQTAAQVGAAIQLAETQRRADAKVAQSQAQAMTAEARAEAERKARLAAERAGVALDSLRKSEDVRDDPRGTLVTIHGEAMFASDSTMLLPSADSRLDDLADVYRAHPEGTVVVQTLGDASGSAEYKQWLRQKRSAAVRSSLIVRGIPAARIRVSNEAGWRAEPGAPTTIEVLFVKID